MARSRLLATKSQLPGVATQAELDRLDPMLRKDAERIQKRKNELMSPPGSLGLPPLLEERRLQVGITDGAFCVQPYNDSVFVHQINRMDQETYAGTGIIMIADEKRREKEQTPQGIVVAAGLVALDSLRMNGMDLGHLVTFCRIAPWRIQTDWIEGNSWEEVLVFRVGDIVGSTDLAENLRDGRVKVRFDPENYEHYYEDENGVNWHPQRDTALIPERS